MCQADRLGVASASGSEHQDRNTFRGGYCTIRVAVRVTDCVTVGKSVGRAIRGDIRVPMSVTIDQAICEAVGKAIDSAVGEIVGMAMYKPIGVVVRAGICRVISLRLFSSL